MKKITSICAMVIFMISVIAIGAARAAEPQSISAEDAFDMRAAEPDRVVIVDIRTAAEYYWVGTCAEVTEIKADNDEITYVPDNGKVKLISEDTVLQFEEEGELIQVDVDEVTGISISRIAENIPCHIWSDADCDKETNPDFAEDIEALAKDYDVIILMCRSGKRTTTCTFDYDSFDEVYEIDHPDKNGHGGLQGSSYSERYNGYRGFPERNTSSQDYESVSWSDAGLPILIGECPESGD